MANIQLNFDSAMQPLQPDIILSYRDLTHVGVIHASALTVKPTMVGGTEISFTVHKMKNGKLSPYWERITDLMLVYVQEWDTYFQISVQVDETDETIKQVLGTSLCESELGQIMIYDLEVNTESDIARDDYKKPSVLYDPTDPQNSLLHRALEKAPHYEIVHVDSSLRGLIRSFSVDSVAIYDFFTNDIATELGCLFEFGVGGRTISVYDLENRCVACGERIGTDETCPHCGSTDIVFGYGEDTSILISSANVGDSLSRSSDLDSIKNCFRLEAGDDLMTATIANINPNGSRYIYHFSDMQLAMMPEALQEKLQEYDKLYASLIGVYTELTQTWYDLIDRRLQKQASMMPDVEMPEITAETELAKLVRANLSPISIVSLDKASTSSVTNAVLAYAKVLVSGTYKIEASQTSYSNKVWKGAFKVTAYGNDEDTAQQTTPITINVNEDEEGYIKQRIEKALDQLEISDKHYDWTQYNLEMLSSFENAYQGVVDVLIELGISNKSHELYKTMYVPYFEKLGAIQAEMKVRESEIAKIDVQLDEIEALKKQINDGLNMEAYLGEDLWRTLCAYRREQTYSNTNYISSGLSNVEVINKAQEFTKVANKELIRASNPIYTLSGSLRNILAHQAFKPLWRKFKIGNWLRMDIDNEIHKMRLISFELSFDNIMSLSVEFSDAVRTHDGTSDLQSILNKAQSMATSYEYVAHQATNGESASSFLRNWFQNGLDATTIKLVNNQDNQSVVMDGHGILNRRYDDELGDYSPEQTKILNSGMYITSDNWRSTETAVGRYFYVDPVTHKMTSAYGVNARVIVGQLILGESLRITNDTNTLTMDEDGFRIANGLNAFVVNPNTHNMVQVQKLTNGEFKAQMYIDSNGNLHFEDGTIIGAGAQISGAQISGSQIQGGSINLGSMTVPVTGPNGQVSYVTFAEQLDVEVANIIELNANSAIIKALKSEYIDAEVINADIANIKNLMAGNAGVGELQAITLTAQNVTISEATINEIIATKINTLNLTSGSINTNDFTIFSDDGKKGLKIVGNTIQLYNDKGDVGVQLGYDATGRPSLLLQDEEGNVLLDSTGLHKGIVPDDFIQTEMLADNSVTSSKIPWIDIAGAEDVNGNPIWSTASIHMDGKSLEVKFNENQTLAQAASCTPLFEDCDFALSFNEVEPYNTTSGVSLVSSNDSLKLGNVEIIRTQAHADTSTYAEGASSNLYDAPTRSEYILEIKTYGSAQPNHGGIQQEFEVRANARYIIRYLAKVPEGCSLELHHTGLGTGGSCTWMTSNQGTGKWNEYIAEIKCGESGTFGFAGYLSIKSTNTYSSSNPLVWYLASIRAVDMAYEMNISSFVQSTQEASASELKQYVDQKTIVETKNENGEVVQTEISSYLAQQSTSLEGINSTIKSLTTYYDEDGNPVEMTSLATKIAQNEKQILISFENLSNSMEQEQSRLESYIRFGDGSSEDQPQIQLGKTVSGTGSSTNEDHIFLNLNNDQIWMANQNQEKLTWWTSTAFNSKQGIFTDHLQSNKVLQVGQYQLVAEEAEDERGHMLTLIYAA